MTAIVDTIESLAHEVAAAHRALPAAGRKAIAAYCADPAAAWAADAAARGRSLPINPATKTALAAALTDLRDASLRA